MGRGEDRLEAQLRHQRLLAQLPGLRRVRMQRTHVTQVMTIPENPRSLARMNMGGDGLPGLKIETAYPPGQDFQDALGIEEIGSATPFRPMGRRAAREEQPEP